MMVDRGLVYDHLDHFESQSRRIENSFVEVFTATGAGFEERWAWSWINVEAEAALIRQKADALAWQAWHRIARSLTLIKK
ncbi:MAG: hypothetical protein R6U56_09010 [Opitutales bacterium]